MTVAEKDHELSILTESFEHASAALLALRAEDEGFAPLNRLKNEDSFSLEALQDIAKMAELQTTGNPLLKRGLSLRTSNVFGKGIFFEGNIPARAKTIMEKPNNYRVLHSEEAYMRNEREAFNKGTLLMAYRKSTQTFFPIPFAEITNSASNPDYDQDVWYYQRSYTEVDVATGQAKPNPTVVWYPVLERFEQGKLDPIIYNEKVDGDVVVVDFKVNTSIGSVWGVPDCLPAMPYAWAHAEYIRDASKLLKALSTIAWKVVSKSKSNAQTSGARMARPTGPGSTATMTEGTDLVSMPRAGQVNMKDGQSIASYVAAALEVSVVALLSDPGSASGSYGAAATLDSPTANSARARQALWADFYRRIYRAVGVKDVVVNFPKISEDPVHRQIQSLTQARVAGGLWGDEYRGAVLELLDIVSQHDNAPEMEEYAPAGGALQLLLAEMAAEAAEEAAKVAATQAEAAANNGTGQGQSNVAGALADGDNGNRDAETTPGTGS